MRNGPVRSWWPEGMKCFCFLRNTTTILENGNTAYKNRFGSGLSGPIIPFDAQVTYLPITQKDKQRPHAFGSKALPGIFLGHSQQAGGGWSGDLYVLDWEELAAATHFSDVHVKDSEPRK